jgi:hypothetical protein
MKYRIEDTFGWPVDAVVPILGGEKELIEFEDLPNVSKRKQIERRRNGAKLYKVFEWNVHGQMPKAAQKIISPDKLTFTEHSVWDDDARCFDTWIEPHFLKNLISCRSKSAWHPIDGGRTRRVIEGQVDFHMPIIGPLVEGAVVDYLKKNTAKGTVQMKKAFEEKIGPENA